MADQTLNREQIIGQVADEAQIPRSKVRKIILEVEDEILQSLKAAGKVRLDHFGTLYVLNRKSRMIKQVRTKSARLLLEQKTVRFRSSPELKNILTGKAIARPKPKITEPKSEKPVTQREQIVEIKKTASPETAEKKPAALKPFKFKPLRIYQKAEREKVREIIIRKFLHLAKQSESGAASKQLRPYLESYPEGKLFGAIFKTITADNIQGLSFSLDKEESVDIFQIKPRKKITTLPRKTVEKFCERYLDLHVYDIPQERFVKIFSNSKIRGKIMIRAHSIPTSGGASFNLRVEKA